jgi:sec-independent protein translocase protein TatC
VALVPFPSQNRNDEENLPAKPGGFSPFGDDDEPAGEGRMTFLEHLDELRKRITHAVGGLLVGFILSFTFISQVFDFVYQRLVSTVPGGKLIYTEAPEMFMLWIKIAALTGVLIASPYIMLQVWLFIAPGLYSHEKKMAIPFVVLSSICFIAGAAFSHYIVFPLTWKFFVSFTSDYLTFMPRIEPAFSLYIKMILAFGLVFQMPTIVLFLARMGVVTAGFLWRHTKYALLIIVIVSAIVTPDGGGVSLVAMSIPLFFLYLFSILLAWVFGKKRNKEFEEEEA